MLTVQPIGLHQHQDKKSLPSHIDKEYPSLIPAHVWSMKLSLHFLFIHCLLGVFGSPYEEFLERVNEYKKRSLESSECGWWKDILRLHFQHENYCEDGRLTEAMSVNDFERAGVAWITVMEWDNPMLTDRVRNTLLSRLTTMPWWLDEAGS